MLINLTDSNIKLPHTKFPHKKLISMGKNTCHTGNHHTSNMSHMQPATHAKDVYAMKCSYIASTNSLKVHHFKIYFTKSPISKHNRF